MRSGQIQSSLQDILQIIIQAFVFLKEFIETSASRMSYTFAALSHLTPCAEQLLSSQQDKTSDLKSKLSDASQNFQLSPVAKHYIENSEYSTSARQDCELMELSGARRAVLAREAAPGI